MRDGCTRAERSLRMGDGMLLLRDEVSICDERPGEGHGSELDDPRQSRSVCGKPGNEARSAPLQSRPRPHYGRTSYVGHLQLHCSLVLHVDGGDDVHARLFADCWRYELEAGDLHHPPGKSDRAHPDASECARGGEVRDTVSCVCARQLRDAWSESSCDAAGLGRLRMVRDSVVAWGAGVL